MRYVPLEGSLGGLGEDEEPRGGRAEGISEDAKTPQVCKRSGETRRTHYITDYTRTTCVASWESLWILDGAIKTSQTHTQKKQPTRIWPEWISHTNAKPHENAWNPPPNIQYFSHLRAVLWKEGGVGGHWGLPNTLRSVKEWKWGCVLNEDDWLQRAPCSSNEYLRITIHNLMHMT